ncbi:permease [Cucumibacter marinus]|uniref:permease n=1 Tax=Cucumibacter marinus TaxID=1121252 RepID=UPI000416774F|nr:permease [Cucumibacter marinus]
MTDLSSGFAPQSLLRQARRHSVWLAIAAILVLVAILSPGQAADSLVFVGDALSTTGPFLVLSVVIAAWAAASGADNLIARAFTGSPAMMIALAALAGAFSPFCSCGVIPLIAALLSMGVPLYAVMAFWLASPIMDPSMFALTSGVLGVDFALVKTVAALALGAGGGFSTLFLVQRGLLAEPLRAGIGNGGCGGARIRDPKPVVWQIWAEQERRAKFGSEALKTGLFLGKWLILAFLLESLMVAFIPAETVTALLGGEGFAPVAIATLVGVPAYLNGYAALPLVAGLIDQGMAPGAGLAFLVAGGVTSIPAAMAVWALVKPKVFGLYIALSLGGSFIAGLVYQAALSL